MNPNLQNAQNDIALAQVDFDGLNNQLSVAEFQNSQQAAQITALQAQLAQATSVRTFNSLEWTPALVAGGSVANSAGNTGVAGDAQSIPSGNIQAYRDIFPNGAYQDKYWYWKLGADNAKNTYSFSLRLMLPEPSLPQAVELDVQQVISGTCYNTGLQFNFQAGVFRIWNRSNTPVHGWIPTAIPCPRWTANAWHTIQLDTHRDDRNVTPQNVYYDAITFDGVKTPLTASFPSIPLANTDCMNCAIQLDSNSAGASYRLYVDTISFTTSTV